MATMPDLILDQLHSRGRTLPFSTERVRKIDLNLFRNGFGRHRIRFV
jgi:hypothetical protein